MSLTLPQRIELSITTAETLVTQIYGIVNGNSTTTVMTASGPVPSVMKKISDIGAAITTAYAAGFVLIVADAAARAAAQAGQAEQMLWQKDTNTLYIANSTTVGDFSVHPLQTAIAAPAGDIAALTLVVAAIEAWRASIDGNDDGVVTSAADIASVLAASAPATDKITVYGRLPTGAAGAKTIPVHRYYELFTGLPFQSVPGALTALLNTSRVSNQNGAFGGITPSGRLITWGVQSLAGSLGRGTTTTTVGLPAAAAVYQNHPSRPMPSFNPLAMKVKKAVFGAKCSALLTETGEICMAGPGVAGTYDIFGSNALVDNLVFRSVYFNASSVNKAMVDFDFETHVFGANSSFVSIDVSGGLWLMTSNQHTIAYSNSITGPVRTPTLISPGVAGWSGKTISKVRTDANGSVFVLMTDKTLWTACGYNATGYLGLGSTSTLSNFTQIQTGVDDFEIAGSYNGDYHTLYILQGTTLKGAGYNGQGQLGTGNTTSQNSFVTIGINVTKMRVAGESTQTVIVQKNDGTFWGCGCNTSGQLGNGALTNVTTLTSLTNLNAVSTAAGGIADFCVADNLGVGIVALVGTNGKAYATGDNRYGQLGKGYITTTDNTFGECLWTPVASDEAIIAVQPACSNTYPTVVWLTNKGRILTAGYETLTGNTTGVPGTQNTNTTILNPIRIAA